MAKHTPGPWDVEQGTHVHDGWTVITARHAGMTSATPLAKISNLLGEEEALPDAHLIAAAPDMYEVLDELEGSFDEQTYAEKSREDFDAPDDREYCVNITAKQLRAISRVLSKAASAARSRSNA